VFALDDRAMPEQELPEKERSDPVDAARELVTEKVSTARGAILAGSVVTGGATEASDLDIVVIADDPDAPYRRSMRFEGWPAEIFVHTEETIHGFWERKDERFRPALALMCGRGVIVLDTDGRAARIQEEAREVLAAGPPPLDGSERDRIRYGLTDSLDDFLADPGTSELPFIVASLTKGLCEVAMENRGAFRGSGKWMLRMANEADPEFARELSAALEALQEGRREPLAALAQAELDAAGGALFEGYWADGRPLLDD
jgi:predicted nucleotidyltransferase